MKGKAVILGGGIAGLGAAYFLGKNNIETILIEKEKTVGGITSCYRIGDYSIEKYYHVILQKDSTLLKLMKELGIIGKLRWSSISTGFYHNGSFYRMNTPLDLLRFKPLGILDRLKFGLRVLDVSRTNDWKHLDETSAREWLIRNWSKNIYDVVFEPLLRTKFGSSIGDASAAFVLGRVRASAKSKKRFIEREKYGYVLGSNQILLDSLENAVKKQKTGILCGTEIVGIRKENGIYHIKIRKNGRTSTITSSYVINTMPLTIFKDILKNFPKEVYSRVGGIKYQAVICMAIGLKRKLSNFWWVNILSKDIPFGVYVEQSNVEGCNQHGEHIIYLAKYLSPEDRFFRRSDKSIIKLYLTGLKKMFSKFNSKDIAWVKIARSNTATPLFTLNYLKRIPPDFLGIDGLYTTGNYLVYPDNRNLSEILKHSFRTSKKMLGKINSMK